MEINADTEAASTVYTNQARTGINSYLSAWVTAENREPGDVTCIEIPGTVKDENGEDMETITAFYVVLFTGKDENLTNLVNVRHILVGFEGEAQEVGTYSDEVKEAAAYMAKHYRIKNGKMGLREICQYVYLLAGLKKHLPDMQKEQINTIAQKQLEFAAEFGLKF